MTAGRLLDSCSMVKERCGSIEFSESRKEVQFVNTATNGPWKFGSINGVWLNFMTGLSYVGSCSFCIHLLFYTHNDLIAL